MKIKHAKFGLAAKNIKVSDTDDGYMWSASFYLDGAKIGTAHDQGHGGEMNTRGIDKTAMAKIETYAASLPHDTTYGLDMAQSAEIVLEENAMSTDSFNSVLKKTKAALRKKVMAKGNKEGIFRTWKIPTGMTAETKMTKLREQKIGETFEFLNELPPEDAMDFLYVVEPEPDFSKPFELVT